MDPSLLTVTCRFFPYDQWLVTHVDPSWKVKQVKLWFISKCISHPTPPPLVHLPSIPNFKRRPTSPIVFASDSKQRAVSPIMFAPLAAASSSLDTGDDEPTAIGLGYEEDDEFDSEDLERSGDPSRSHKHSRFGHSTKLSRTLGVDRPSISGVPTATSEAEIPPAYEPKSLTLIRFATGQLLDDDWTLEDYNIKPGELIEMHRVGVTPPLPRRDISAYVQPYWEGWAKTLRVVYKDILTIEDPKKPSTKNVKHASGDQGTADGRRVDEGPRSTRLEWRDRWVVIRDGLLLLCKDRQESPPSQILSISSVLAIRGAEHLRRSTAVHPTSQQRIICAKFKVQAASGPVDDTSNVSRPHASNAAPTSSKPKSRLNKVSYPYQPAPRKSSLTPTIASTATGVTNTSIKNTLTKPKAKLRIKPPSSAALQLQPLSVLNTKPSGSRPRNDVTPGGSTSGSANHSTVTMGMLKTNRKISEEKDRRGVQADKPQGFEEKAVSWKGKGKAKDTAFGSTSMDGHATGEDDDYDALSADEDLNGSEPVFNKMPWEALAAKADVAAEVSPGFSDADSGLSSPIFAHTNPYEGSDDDDDDSFFGSEEGLRRPGYAYGYRHGYPVRMGGGVGISKKDKKDDIRDYEVVHDESRVKHTVVPDNKSGKSDSKSSGKSKDSKGKAKAKTAAGEWVVLDMGDDNAFTSILRILHRHFPPPISSTFTSVLPSVLTPDSHSTTSASRISVIPLTDSLTASVPNDEQRRLKETLAEFRLPEPNHPESPARARDPSFDSAQSSPTSRFQFELPPLPQDTRLNRLPSTLLEPSDTEPSNVDPSAPPAQSHLAPHHPTSLVVARRKSSTTFGALPYPEWRTTMVEKARRAGVGEVGRAMECFLFGPHTSERKTSQAADTLKEWKRKSHRKRPVDPGELGLRLEARRKRADRMSHASSSMPSPLGDDPERTSTDESDSGEESSEAEWLGWMADLHRQGRVTKKLQEQAVADAKGSKHSLPGQDGYLPDLVPSSQAEHQRRLQEERRALEPSAVVTTAQTTYPPSSPPEQQLSELPAAIPLSSPSSAESLTNRHQPFVSDFSPVDPLSSATSPAYSHSHSQSQSHLKTVPSSSQQDEVYEPWSPVVTTDFTSQEHFPPRRPSMPTILGSGTPSFFVSSGTGSGSKTSSQPRSSIKTPAEMPAASSSYVRDFDERLGTALPVGPFGYPVPGGETTTTITSGANTVPRRASTSGLIGAATGSMGRSASLLTRGPGLLRKKGSDTGKDKEQRAKAKQDKETANVQGDDTSSKKGRPRLSISASYSSRQSLNQNAKQNVPTSPRATSPTAMARSIIRRVKSSSSLMSGDEAGQTLSIAEGQPMGIVKKKKGAVK